jgi:hypothetical protein
MDFWPWFPLSFPYKIQLAAVLMKKGEENEGREV